MKRSAIFIVFIILATTRTSFAQGGPPFMGGGTGFDPEPDTVFSGALLDAQVVVSHDRRYVTITTGATNTDLQDLVLFPVQQVNGGGGAGGGGAPALGFVGGLNPAGDAALAIASAARATGDRNASAVNNAINRSPTAIASQNSVLNQQGMFLLAPLE